MNTRRKLVIALGAGALTAPFASLAQQQGKVWRVGTLDFGTALQRDALWAAFHLQLRELGYKEGRNITVERRWAEGNRERLAELAADLVKAEVDIIATAGTVATLAAARATATVPTVFAILAGDPVALGMIASFARPGGNITGNTSLSSDLTGKRLALIKEAIPSIQRVAILWEKASPSAEQSVGESGAAAKSLGIAVGSFPVEDGREIEAAFSRIVKSRAQVVVVASGSLFFSERKRLAELAIKNRLPTMFSVHEYVDAGGLFSYGPDLKDGLRRAAIHVDKILKGAKAADIPVERPTTFEFVINRKTAKILGLSISQAVLLRADRMIE